MAESSSLIKLEEHIISDSALGYSRRVRLLRGSSKNSQKLCLFLDGELYLEKMKVAPVLRDLINRDSLPSVTFAFIDHLDMKSREHDYICNEPFGHFIGEAVIPYLQKQIHGLPSAGHLIAGLSLSGLASAWLALQRSGQFNCCLSQSGSFWWNDQFFAKMAAQHAAVTTRFWLSVGDQETEVDEPPEVSQVEGVKNAYQVLKTLGAMVYYHEYKGGHDLKFWRSELDKALHWLFSKQN